MVAAIDVDRDHGRFTTCRSEIRARRIGGDGEARRRGGATSRDVDGRQEWTAQASLMGVDVGSAAGQGVDEGERAYFRVSLGPEVQTLTRAMTSILCKGLAGSSPEKILALEADFVPRIIGANLVRQRSQTVYYVLGRMKGALTVWRNRRRTAV